MSAWAPVTYVDTHAHLDDAAFDTDRDAVVGRAIAAGVRAMVNVGYRPGGWERSVALAARSPAVSVMLGVHPRHAEEYDAGSEQALAAALRHSRAVALGEVGLDYFRGNPDAAAQRWAFRSQLELAAALHLPVVIHQRAAEDDLLHELSTLTDLPRLVLHSFDGSHRLARFALDRGAVLGIGGLATRASSGALRAVLADVPPTAIVLETDAPYLIPAGARGRRNEPANVPRIATRLAHLWGLSAQELAEMTTATAVELFGLDLPPDPNLEEASA